MGLKYLDGQSWAEVTREERFFCAHLFYLIQREGLAGFVSHLNEKYEASLQVTANWELAYEACFYRDFWHLRGKKGPLFSPKRTFDLCLFSDDVIVVIEAKAHQSFDEEQLDSFEKDKTQLVKETGVGTVLLSGLASSRYDIPQRIRSAFNGPYMTWLELAKHYGDDAILRRADEVFAANMAGAFGKYNTGSHMTGEELLVAHGRGEEFFVGRGGGLDGHALADDIASGGWKHRRYETNRDAVEPPSRNWFRLSDFVNRLGGKA